MTLNMLRLGDGAGQGQTVYLILSLTTKKKSFMTLTPGRRTTAAEEAVVAAADEPASDALASTSFVVDIRLRRQSLFATCPTFSASVSARLES